MKIALVHTKLMNRGGLERRLINYTNYLTSKNHQVTIFCAKFSDQIILPQGVKVVKIKLNFIPKKLETWYFAKKLSKIFNKNEFDFSLSFGRSHSQDAVLSPATHRGYLFAIKKKIKKINDYIQIYTDTISYNSSKIIFAASNIIKSELIDLYKINEDKIHVVYPPVNIQKFNLSLKSQKNELRQKYGISIDKIVFAFVTINLKLKGIDLLIDIFNELDSEKYELVVVGWKKMSINHRNIKFLGYINSTEEIYSAVDFTIHPSKYEPFGQIISESLQCGTPVIVSDKVGASEILNNDNGVIINSFNKNVWIDEIKKLENRKFIIDENFAVKNGLTIEQHINKMLQIGLNLK